MPSHEMLMFDLFWDYVLKPGRLAKKRKSYTTTFRFCFKSPSLVICVF